MNTTNTIKIIDIFEKHNFKNIETGPKLVTAEHTFTSTFITHVETNILGVPYEKKNIIKINVKIICSDIDGILIDIKDIECNGITEISYDDIKSAFDKIKDMHELLIREFSEYDGC